MATNGTPIFYKKSILIALLFFIILTFNNSYAQTQTTYAVIGDFGYNGSKEGNVASMIDGWNPDYVLTVGDNIYEDRTTSYSTAVGDYYHQYMYPHDPNYSSDTQTTNRFWPVVGNHDWVIGHNLDAYLNYFQMVNNKRYYSVTLGNIEFFAIDSDPHEDNFDGTSYNSTQGQWLQQQLANSSARWKIVLFHHPAYCSSGDNSYMQWPFKSWGADAVISGHIHYYERLMANNLVYFVNGLGGASIKGFGSASNESQKHYDSDYGAMKITEIIGVGIDTLKFQFFSLGDKLQDTYIIDRPLPVELVAFNASLIGSSSVKLNWSTATEVNNYGFDIERSNGNSNNWQKVGFISGAGNSNTTHSYTFEDNPTGGNSFSYRLKQIDFDGVYKYYGAITVSLNSLVSAKLLQNNPNPFNPSTAIKFYIPGTSKVTIKIYDVLGREIRTLFDEQTDAGYHVVYWNGDDRNGNTVSSGVYIYTLTDGSFFDAKKMNFLK